MNWLTIVTAWENPDFVKWLAGTDAAAPPIEAPPPERGIPVGYTLHPP